MKERRNGYIIADEINKGFCKRANKLGYKCKVFSKDKDKVENDKDEDEIKPKPKDAPEDDDEKKDGGRTNLATPGQQLA